MPKPIAPSKENPAFKDSAVIIAAHGSTRHPDSAKATHRLAASLREANRFAQVKTAFWKQEPYFCAALRGIYASRVFVFPFFISEGYFTREVLPRELLAHRRPQRRKGTDSHNIKEDPEVYFCRPAGYHPSMTEAILNRARQAVQSTPPANRPIPDQTTLVIAGHGTDLNAQSRESIESQRSLVAKRNVFADVREAFIEETPGIQDVPNDCRTRDVIVVPFFVSEGQHTQDDIPRLLKQGEPSMNSSSEWKNPTVIRGKRIWYAESIGMDPGMVDVVFDAVVEAHGLAISKL